MNYIKNLLKGQKVEWKTLGEIGYFYGGLTGKNKNDFSDGNAKYITYMNVFKNLAVDFDIDDWVKVNQGEKQNKVQYGDVLFTGSSENPDECGMSSVINQEINEDVYLNSFCFGFRLNEPQLFEPDFLKHLFRGKELRKQIGKTANGVTRFNVSKKLMAKIKIPLPPLAVQKEIANILDKFTTLEAELEAELDCRLRQYHHYRDTLLTFGNEVEWKTLGEVILHLRTGLNPRKNFSLNTNDAQNFYITVRELGGTEIKVTDKTDKVNDEALLIINNRSKLKKGDVLFSGTGTIGNTALVSEEPKNWNIKEGVYAITPNSEILHSKFLLRLFQSDNIKKELERKAMGGIVKSVSMADLQKIKIPLPSLEEQKRIVNILDKFDTLTNSITEGLPKEIELRRKQYEYYREKLLMFNC